MSLEKLRTKREDIAAQIERLQNQILDLKRQIENAQNTVRQWTDSILIERGRLLEIDALIGDMESESLEEEEEKEN